MAEQLGRLRGPEAVACGSPCRLRHRPRPGGPADEDHRDQRRPPRKAPHDHHRRDDAAPRHPDLVKRGWAAPTGIDQLWVADFSYVWTLAGFCYVAFVVDVFSRRMLGWRVTTTKHTGMVTDALRQALQVRRRGEHDWVAAGLIHHSDAGSQYVSVAFTAELLAAGIAGSIGTVGDALDNALCESTIGLFKTEAINLTGPAWADRRDVEWQVARWVHWYNTDRLHSSIGHLPPVEFEHHHRQARTATPDLEVA